MVAFDPCVAEISTLTNIGPKLGLVVTPVPTFGEIIQLYKEGRLTANVQALGACVTEIGLLACDDPAVQNAYSPSAPVPFAGPAELLKPVCLGVFDGH